MAQSSALDDEQKNKESCINFLAEVGVIASGGKTYEEEFALEMVKARQGKAKSTPWGSSFAPPPEVLHGEWWEHSASSSTRLCGAYRSRLPCDAFQIVCVGYNKKVTGKTAEERLDMRSAIKSDKVCFILSSACGLGGAFVAVSSASRKAWIALLIGSMPAGHVLGCWSALSRVFLRITQFCK